MAENAYMHNKGDILYETIIEALKKQLRYHIVHYGINRVVNNGHVYVSI